MHDTVKRGIMEEDLFEEIGVKTVAKISGHQMKKISSPPTFFR